jgi:hypothetical protein
MAFQSIGKAGFEDSRTHCGEPVQAVETTCGGAGRKRGIFKQSKVFVAGCVPRGDRTAKKSFGGNLSCFQPRFRSIFPNLHPESLSFRENASDVSRGTISIGLLPEMFHVEQPRNAPLINHSAMLDSFKTRLCYRL